LLNKPIILYVENDPGSRKVMRLLVTRFASPVDLTIFEDSSNFMSRVKALPIVPDVFLLDIHVSPLDGFEMLYLLRHHESYMHCMIVALTASVMNSEVYQLKEAGFDGILAKPLHFHTFPATLERILTGERIWTVHR